METKGKLKIFLGYAAGSGKTYTMLEAAHDARKHQVDVVAGYIEPHNRPDTQALTEGLEVISPVMVDYKGVKLREFNLDAALKRKPELILVDELAHTNASGCRNKKRYQDVGELLRAGINVYTTMNIQHLESLNDVVGSITGIEVRERVPDSIFDHADQIEVIDLEPEELIERLKEGKIYNKVQADRALQNFFRQEKLVALREITLRRAADRVNRIAEEERNSLGKTDYHTGEHILVCISAAPSSARVIRTASRLAYAFHGRFTGLYVETPQMQEADEKTKATLKNHLEMAKALGARIVTVYGLDVISQIAEYAMVSNVSKIVMGRTNHITFRRNPKREALEKLNCMAPNIDVYIIPDVKQTKLYHRKHTGKREGFADRKAYILYGTLFGVLIFNFFFTEPFFSLRAYGKWQTIFFALLFLVGLLAVSMNQKLKLQNRKIAKIAYRTEILLENSRKLTRCTTKQEVWDTVAQQVGKLLSLSLLVYPVGEKGILEEPVLYPREGMTFNELVKCVNPKEKAVVQWVAANHHRAGACTHTLPDAMAMYLPIQDAEEVKGIMGIFLEERRPVPDFKYELLIAMLNEAGVKLR